MKNETLSAIPYGVEVPHLASLWLDAEGNECVVVSHRNIPATEGRPITISYRIIDTREVRSVTLDEWRATMRNLVP